MAPAARDNPWADPGVQQHDSRATEAHLNERIATVHNIHEWRRANRRPGHAAAWRAPLFGAVAIAVTACGNSTGVDTISNPDDPTDAVLFDFLDGEVRNPSAFDILAGSPVRLDSNTRWDFVFQIGQDGTAHLRPRGVIIGETGIDAGLAKLTVTFDEVQSAPAGGYERLRATTIEEGDVLAMQSQRDALLEPVRCRRYGKIEVLAIDTAAGTVTFHHLINPNCENRNLVPGAAVPIEDQ